MNAGIYHLLSALVSSMSKDGLVDIRAFILQAYTYISASRQPRFWAIRAAARVILYRVCLSCYLYCLHM